MTSLTAEIRAFLDEFERNSAELAIDRIAAQFADTFMNADPQRVMPVPKAAFIAALPQREKMFQAAGISRIRLASEDKPRAAQAGFAMASGISFSRAEPRAASAAARSSDRRL